MAVAILTLVDRGETATLRLELDPRRERRALAHGGGVALSHAGVLTGNLRDVVLALGRTVAGLPAHEPPSLELASDAIRARVRELAPSAVLRVRAAPGVRALPRWPSWVRTGAPDLARGRLWPFDPELVGLELGRRRIVKREAFDDAAEGADRAWLEARGVTVIRVGPIDPDGRRVMFGALDPRALDDGVVAAEHALRGRDDGVAARVLGAALGYPACCVEAFVAAIGRDDLSLAHAMLPPPTSAPAPAETTWLAAPLALISHTPCGPRCAPTLGLAIAVRDELERSHPGFAARWRELASTVQIVDDDGRVLVVRGDGSLGGGVRITSAVELRPSIGHGVGEVAVAAPSLIGRVIRVEDADHDDVRAVLAADHTGALAG